MAAVTATSLDKGGCTTRDTLSIGHDNSLAYTPSSMRRTSLPWPHYACDWSLNSSSFCTLAVGSFLPSLHNYIQILSLADPTGKKSRAEEPRFRVVADALPIEYVPTKLMWSPTNIKNNEYLAASGNGVYVWRKVGDETIVSGDNDDTVATHNDISFSMTGHLISKHGATLSTANASQPRRVSEGSANTATTTTTTGSSGGSATNPLAPVTSFDWNRPDPTRLVTASYDTTCTVWCLETGTIRTQLIAHDKEVFDVAFNPSSTDIFVSVGADGSLRLFDIRSLDHSTILYENPEARPLLRVQWNTLDTNYLATLALESSKVVVMDVRMPSVPAAEIGPGAWQSSSPSSAGENTPIVAIRWSPSSSSHLMTMDERIIRLWDLSDYDRNPRARWAFDGMELSKSPLETLSMMESIPLQCLLWPAVAPDWIAVTSSDQVSIMHL